ncbi:iron permease FTR1 [Stipitochalara longipes BDJ]|nr:iron permease FTR1 [Stipitochalara longipes BDJ]
MTVDVFAVPVFFVVFRETLETVILMSVLLAFLKQTLDGPNGDLPTYKKLVKQVWFGTLIGVVLVLIIGGAIIGVFYGLGKDKWSQAEYLWEGSFALAASLIITLLGATLLRVAKMQEKWRVKLAKAIEDDPIDGWLTRLGCWPAFKLWSQRYAMFVLPFITVLREGLEAVVFIAGVSFSAPASAVPLPVITGLLAGSVVGYLIYKGGASSKLQLFLVVSTCFLYLVAAGLFSRGVWYLEANEWNKIVGSDAAELGAGAGSYDIDQSVWHVNFGNPELNGGGGWGIFNAILGWQNSATYGSVISYNLYWLVVIIGFLLMRYQENTGHLPFMKSKGPDHPQVDVPSVENASGASSRMFETRTSNQTDPEKAIATVQAMPARTDLE